LRASMLQYSAERQISLPSCWFAAYCVSPMLRSLKACTLLLRTPVIRHWWLITAHGYVCAQGQRVSARAWHPSSVLSRQIQGPLQSSQVSGHCQQHLECEWRVVISGA
jgi:hypothetical protein